MSTQLTNHQDDDMPPGLTVRPSNPFGIAEKNKAMVESESSRSIAEVQSALVIARRFPRDPQKAMDNIINACTRPSLAESAIYTYARGGSDISGPSIRLAEVLAQHWGNLNFGIRELEQGSDSSTVEAFAWDLETNTRQSKIFQVPHIRYSKNKGNTKLSDPRDIYENIANNGARRLRACILGVIPGDVVEAALQQCEVTQQANADVSPDNVQRMMKAFGEFGVTKEMVESRIQRKLEAIRPAQMLNLKKVYASLKDGMSEPADWFTVDGPPAPATQTPKFKKETPAPTPQDTPAPETPPAAQESQEQPAQPVSCIQDVRDAMESDAIRSNEVVAYLYAHKMAPSDKIALKSVPEEGLLFALANWKDVVASTVAK